MSGKDAPRNAAAMPQILRLAEAVASPVACALLAPYDLDPETATIMLRFVTARLEQDFVALADTPAAVLQRVADALGHRDTGPRPAPGGSDAAGDGLGFPSLF